MQILGLIGEKKQIHKTPQTNIWSNLCGLPGLGVMVVSFCWRGWVLGGGGGPNAPRTVGTLGRGELSPPITITACAQKGGGAAGGEQAQKIKNKRRKK